MYSPAKHDKILFFNEIYELRGFRIFLTNENEKRVINSLIKLSYTITYISKSIFLGKSQKNIANKCELNTRTIRGDPELNIQS